VLQGSIQETYAKEHWEKQGVTVVSYKDQNMAWGDLLNGRIDASLVMSAAGQAGFLSKPQGKGFGFIGKPVSDDTILGSGIGFGLRKGDEATKSSLMPRLIKYVPTARSLNSLISTSRVSMSA
jgi:lysine/arginine/ornithine transport system substrate-binding protein